MLHMGFNGILFFDGQLKQSCYESRSQKHLKMINPIFSDYEYRSKGSVTPFISQ